MVVIEMNPRVSRSSALASKATGFPIAKVAAKLAVGYTLDELDNDITGGATPASFEPTIDYVVTKIPRFAFEKFPGAEPTADHAMKSVGEVMAIGRTFHEPAKGAARPGDRPDRPRRDRDPRAGEGDDKNAIRARHLARRRRTASAQGRPGHAPRAERWRRCTRVTCNRSLVPGQIARSSSRWQRVARARPAARTPRMPARSSAMGFSDARLAQLTGQDRGRSAAPRRELGVRPVFKRIDTCAAEFASPDRLHVLDLRDPVCEAPNARRASPTRKKVVILGGGPNRIGQGIEFDYCCCHACLRAVGRGLRDDHGQLQPGDRLDRLRHLRPALFRAADRSRTCWRSCARSRSNGTLHGVIVQFGGQTPLKLANALEEAGIPILGTSPDAIDLAEDRDRFQKLLHKLDLKQPEQRHRHSVAQAKAIGPAHRLPAGHPPVLRAGRPRDVREIVSRYINTCLRHQPGAVRQLPADAIEVDVDAVRRHRRHVAGIMEHIEEAGIHSGDSACSLPPTRSRRRDGRPSSKPRPWRWPRALMSAA
jgi:carbamoyl-phosphate synthase large subunit